MNQPTAFLDTIDRIGRKTAAENPNNNESMLSSTKTTAYVVVYVFNDASDDSGDEGYWLLCEPYKDSLFKSEKVKLLTFASSCAVDEDHSPLIKTGCVPNITATAGEPDNTNALTPTSGILVDDNSQTCSLDDMEICSFTPNLYLSWNAYPVDDTTIGLPLDSTHIRRGDSAISSSRDMITPPPITSTTNASDPPAALKQPIRIPRAGISVCILC